MIRPGVVGRVLSALNRLRPAVAHRRVIGSLPTARTLLISGVTHRGVIGRCRVVRTVRRGVPVRLAIGLGVLYLLDAPAGLLGSLLSFAALPITG